MNVWLKMFVRNTKRVRDRERRGRERYFIIILGDLRWHIEPKMKHFQIVCVEFIKNCRCSRILPMNVAVQGVGQECVGVGNLYSHGESKLDCNRRWSIVIECDAQACEIAVAKYA